MNDQITLPILKKMAILSLVILLVFLVSWNIENYNNARTDLEQKLEDQMELACSEYRDSIFQFIFRRIDVDSSSSSSEGNYPENIFLQTNRDSTIKWQNKIGVRMDSLKNASVDTMKIYYFDSNGSSELYGKDDVVAWTKGSSRRFNLDFESNSDTIITFNSHHSIFNLEGHANPRLAKTYKLIDTMYRNKLLKNNLPVNYKITFDTLNVDSDIEIKFAYTAFGSSKAPVASFNHATGYIISKNISSLLMSLFLFSLIGLSFLLVFRNIKSRQRLTDIKNNFISNMTHELKTPIATVGVAIEAMESFGVAENPAKRKEYIDICKHEVERLSTLVNKVMRLSFNDQSEQKLTKVDIDIKELLQDTVGNMRLLFSKKNIQYEESIEGDEFVIEADKLHITNVIYNIVDNAIKYSPENSLISISLRSGPSNIQLGIRDQGPGIAKEYQSRIFDRFFRVPNDNIHNTKGHGLGLHYVKSIINAHNGDIQLESQSERGTLFTITLPR